MKEIMSFSNFVFDKPDNIPEIYEALFMIETPKVKIEKIVGGTQDDLFVLNTKLIKIL